jgi:alpha-ketoglutarate-dependent taurine dioxygenase
MLMNSDRGWIPYEITPASTGIDASPAGLAAFLQGPPHLDELLARRKALVFRGFDVTAGTLDSVMDLLVPGRLAYVHGNSPRSKVGKNIYTSTEYPPELTISMHNELSYAARWPSRLLFYCEKVAEAGGATPVVDGARWLESIDPEIRKAFAGGVRYTQNLHDGKGLGKSWQATFETDKRQEVDAYLADANATWSWNANGLRISQVRPATTRHPVTGEEVWFSQFDQWHPAGLGDATAMALAQIMSEEEMPQSVAFADGSPIPADYAVHVRDQGLSEAVDVEWRTGDLLLIDNVLAGHGRRPFTGQRRVLVAMS